MALSIRNVLLKTKSNHRKSSLFLIYGLENIRTDLALTMLSRKRKEPVQARHQREVHTEISVFTLVGLNIQESILGDLFLLISREASPRTRFDARQLPTTAIFTREIILWEMV
jgi:hypothetical protein